MNTNQWFFIINPMAGGGRLLEFWNSIRIEIEKSGVHFQEYFTNHKGDAELAVQRYILKGARKFVAVGGDGTNNDVINGILSQQSVPTTEILCTLLPFGTGNDWRRTHGIPKNIKAWITMLKAQYQINHNAGVVSYFADGIKKQRYFVNVAGLAYDAHVTKAAESYSHQRRRKSLYLWLAIRCLFGFKAPKLKVQFENQIEEDFFYTINIGICKYSGGGMLFTKQAEYNGNQFGLTLIENFPKWRVPFDIPRLYAGSLDKFKYAKLTSTNQLRVTALEESHLGVEVDGDYLGEGPLEFRLIQDALRIIVPKR